MYNYFISVAGRADVQVCNGLPVAFPGSDLVRAGDLIVLSGDKLIAEVTQVDRFQPMRKPTISINLLENRSHDHAIWSDVQKNIVASSNIAPGYLLLQSFLSVAGPLSDPEMVPVSHFDDKLFSVNANFCVWFVEPIIARCFKVALIVNTHASPRQVSMLTPPLSPSSVEAMTYSGTFNNLFQEHEYEYSYSLPPTPSPCEYASTPVSPGAFAGPASYECPIPMYAEISPKDEPIYQQIPPAYRRMVPVVDAQGQAKPPSTLGCVWFAVKRLLGIRCTNHS